MRGFNKCVVCNNIGRMAFYAECKDQSECIYEEKWRTRLSKNNQLRPKIALFGAIKWKMEDMAMS
jgi:hypothetical protein